MDFSNADSELAALAAGILTGDLALAVGAAVSVNAATEVVTETLVYLDVEDSIVPEVSTYIRDFIVPNARTTWETPADTWGEYVEEILISVSSSPSIVENSGLYDVFSGITFNTVSEGFIKMFAEDISKADTFEYGFNFDSPPEIVYFHQEGEMFEGNLAGAIARYGGSYTNPPFYLKEPEKEGFLKIVNSIVPEFNPCKEPTSNVSFPNFSETKEAANSLVGKIQDDVRLSFCEADHTKIIEAPLERALPASAKALNEALIYSTIRLYLSEFMLKSLPVFYFLEPKYPDNYTNLIPEYIIDFMEKGMKDTGRGRRYDENFNDYWLLFLEQVVQLFTTKVEYGLLTDVTESEASALRALYEYVENNWTGERGYVFFKFDPLRTRMVKKDNWRAIMESPTVIENCKVILRRYVGDEITAMSDIVSEAMPTNKPWPIKTINDLILTSPERQDAVTYMAGAINGDENGPVDVPTLEYIGSYGTPGAPAHPLDQLVPAFEDRKWPFVLERYVTYRGTGITHNLGKVANIFDWEEIPETASQVGSELYFGLRVSFVPSESDKLSIDFDSIESNLVPGFDFVEKAFSKTYKNLIPLVSVETLIQPSSQPYSAALYEDYVQTLICLLIQKTEYKMLFTHIFPLARYMSILAVYTANTFVPSMAKVSDGWAATVFGKQGGGQWIGFGKNGGMRTWRGNEGMRNSFHKSKRLARQLLEASCNTNYLYKDRDQLTPSEAFVEMSRPNNQTGVGIKWWQWSSLRPPPCKEED